MARTLGLALARRFDSHGRSIVLSGDTSPSEELVRMATGVDVLISRGAAIGFHTASWEPRRR